MKPAEMWPFMSAAAADHVSSVRTWQAELMNLLFISIGELFSV